MISQAILFDLVLPKRSVVLRSTIVPGTAVPKTAVDIHRHTLADEKEIRRCTTYPSIYAVAKPRAPQRQAKNDFGARISLFDGLH